MIYRGWRQRMSLLGLGVIFSLGIIVFSDVLWAEDGAAGTEDVVSDDIATESAAGHEAAAGHGTLNWFQWEGAEDPPLAYMFMNFALFLAVLYLAAGKKVKKGLLNRQAKVADAIAAAKEKQSAAEKALAHARERADTLDALVASLEVQITNAAKERSDVMLAEANQRAERIKAHALQSLHHELDMMADKMRRQAVEELMVKVEARITAQLSGTQRSVVSDEYLNTLERVAGTTGESS